MMRNRLVPMALAAALSAAMAAPAFAAAPALGASAEETAKPARCG